MQCDKTYVTTKKWLKKNTIMKQIWKKQKNKLTSWAAIIFRTTTFNDFSISRSAIVWLFKSYRQQNNRVLWKTLNSKISEEQFFFFFRKAWRLVCIFLQSSNWKADTVCWLGVIWYPVRICTHGIAKWWVVF